MLSLGLRVKWPVHEFCAFIDCLCIMMVFEHCSIVFVNMLSVCSILWCDKALIGYMCIKYVSFWCRPSFVSLLCAC